MFSIAFLRSSATLFRLLALSLLLAGPLSATDVHRNFNNNCWSAVELGLDTAREVFVDLGGGEDVFRIEISSPGILVPEASDFLHGSLRPSVELTDKDCEPLWSEDVTYVERSLGRPVIKVKAPGIYHLRVTTEATVDQGSYRLRIGFSEAIPMWLSDSVAKEVTEWEDDDESLTGGAGSCSASAASSGEARLSFDEPGILAADAAGSELVAFLEPLAAAGPASVSAGAPLGPSAELLARVEPGHYLLRWTVSEELAGSCGPRFHFYPICGLSHPDDHGDRLACGTQIELGSEVPGELGSDPAADVDLFSFVLAAHASVSVRISGEADGYVSLLDASGRPLASEAGGYGGDTRIEAELCPGRYFLKVEGVAEAAGRYVLITSMEPS